MRKKDYDGDCLALIDNEKASGAYFLPETSQAQFRQEQETMNIFRQISTIVRLDSMGRVITVPPSAVVDFISENQTIIPESSTTEKYDTQAFKVAGITKISGETVGDAAFDLEGAIAADFGAAFGEAEENRFINGGANAPSGLLDVEHGAEIDLTVTGPLSFDDVKKLFFNLKARYRRNGSWIMSDETAFYLRTLKDESGAALWRDADDSIFTRPVFTSPFMPSLGSGNIPIMFGDFRFFWIIEKGGVMLQRLDETYAANDLVGFKATQLIDARLLRREAIKALKIQA
jgi:HK97 family phage major capsid protein